jgi:hypothetical protein
VIPDRLGVSVVLDWVAQAFDLKDLLSSPRARLGESAGASRISWRDVAGVAHILHCKAIEESEPQPSARSGTSTNFSSAPESEELLCPQTIF